MNELGRQFTSPLSLDEQKSEVNRFFSDYSLNINGVDGYEEFENEDFDPSISNLSIKLVDGDGGGEGEGDYAQRTFELNRADDNGAKQTISYFKVEGFYSSYSGTEWEDSFTVVYPLTYIATKYADEK